MCVCVCACVQVCLCILCVCVCVGACLFGHVCACEKNRELVKVGHWCYQAFFSIAGRLKRDGDWRCTKEALRKRDRRGDNSTSVNCHPGGWVTGGGRKILFPPMSSPPHYQECIFAGHCQRLRNEDPWIHVETNSSSHTDSESAVKLYVRIENLELAVTLINLAESICKGKSEMTRCYDEVLRGFSGFGITH